MFIDMSACQILDLIKAGNASAEEVAKEFIDQIYKVNPAINAIQQFYPEKILFEARKKDKEVSEGKILGKLHGLPISLKDGFYAPGFRGAKGSIKLYETSSIDKSATAVQRLVDEGAIILGITNVPEFLAATETDNLLNGRTNNPYDLSRVAGGSSGGEAALIAAGGSCVGLGSDAGGSIRTPSHFCGIAGIKPTKGLVPLTGNVPRDVGGLHTQLATFGPMARKVEDLELLLSVIAGADGCDPACAPVKLLSSSEVDVSRLKVIYFLDNGIATPCDETIQVIESALNKLRPQVAKLEVVRPPEILRETFKLVWETCYLGGNSGEILCDTLSKIGQTEFSPLYSDFIEQAKDSSFSTAELHRRISEIYQYKLEMLAMMRDADVLICPVVATVAREHGTSHQYMKEVSYGMAFNLTGWPAVSINSGFSKSPKLPIGMQIAAKPWEDHVVLAFAKKAQEVLGVPNIILP